MDNRNSMPSSPKVEAKVDTPKVEAQPVAKSIQVVAMRAGFYKQTRKVEGDKFTIDGEHQLGSWMKKI